MRPKFEEIYKISTNTITRLRKKIGLPARVALTKKEYDYLEKAIVKYQSDRVNVKNIKRVKIIKKRIERDGYIEAKIITRLFGGRNAATAIIVVEKLIGIELYYEDIKVLRHGKTEDSKSCDEYKYKKIKVYKSLTALFAEWKKERITGPAKNGDAGAGSRKGWHRIC